MKKATRSTVDDRLLAVRSVQTPGFRYPERYFTTMTDDRLPEASPFRWLAEYDGDLEFWSETVATQFPAHILVPFAKHEDTDDVFCFEGTDHSGNPPVHIIHTFATPGWEYRGTWSSFDLWWEEMEEQHAAWLAEQESEED